MASLGSLVIELAANTARLQGDLGRGVSMIQNFASKAKSVVGLLGVGAGGGLFASLARQAISLGDELQKGAQRAGISAGRFSELAAAAKQADVDIGTLSKGLRNLQNAISEAASGNKAAADAFYELGLSVSQLRDLSADKQLLAISKALEGIPNQTDRVRLGTVALGKAYQELVPLINEGAAGLTRLVEEQKKLGATFSDEQIKKLADTDEAIKRLKASWEGLATTLTASVAPALTTVFEALSKPPSLENQRRTVEARLQSAVQGPERDRLLQELEDIRHQERLAAIDRRPTFNRGAIGPNAMAEFRRQELLEREAREKAQKEFDSYYKSLQGKPDSYLEMFPARESIQVFKEEDLAGMERVWEGAFDGMQAIEERHFENLSKELKETEEQFSIFGDQAARNLQSAFADFLFDPFQDGLRGMLKGFIDVIRRMAAEAAAARVFESLFGQGSSGGGALSSFFGSLFGGVGGAKPKAGTGSNIAQGEHNWLSEIFKGVGSIFGGKRAAGGPVSAGRAYLVGEKGPELFMPNQSGSIAANGAMPPIVINNNIDARGATMDLAAALPGILERNNEMLTNRIVSGIQRGKFPLRR